MPRTYPCLWFDTQAQEAAEFYVSVFPLLDHHHPDPLPQGVARRVPAAG